MKKNAISILTVFLLLIFLSRIFLFNWQNFFRHNILNPIPQSVADFKYQKDTGAMHGAIIFQFKADKTDFDSIIETRNLVRYDAYPQIPDWIRYVLENRFKNTDWWDAKELISMQVYGLTWDDNEPHALFFFADKYNKIYEVVL